MMADLKNNFIMIEYLRKRILQYFLDIEDDKISVDATNKAVLDKISATIQDFINRVNTIYDIHEYSGIPFKMKDADGKVITREFTEKELESMYEVWVEDCSTFETQFEMYVYKYAIKQKIQSITNAYNSKSVDHPISAEDVYRIFGMTVLSDIQQFTYHHSFLKRLVYSTVPGITIKRTVDSLIIDYVPHSAAAAKMKALLMKSAGLSEGYYGFFNPFDSDEPVKKQIPLEAGSDDSREKYKITKTDIKRISLWNCETPAKAVYTDGKMLAGKYFMMGDVIERCPIKYMHEDDLYSKNIRDNVFPIDPENGLYAFPLGNALCYRNSNEAGKPGNITYEFDDSTDCLVFTALKKIHKGDELVLQVSDEDYINELKPHQLKYGNDYQEEYSKGIRFI